MKISILTENFAGAGFLAEHGLSYLIEFEGNKLLFDVGATDVFLKNALKMSIKLEDIETVVLSHGHWDHGGGLSHIHTKKLITHPSSFIKRYRLKDHSEIGLPETQKELKKRFHINCTSDPVEIFPSSIFLGEIPRRNNFEAKSTSFIDATGNPDFVPDDSALVFIQKNELIIVTGCSHSGICNIIEYAIEVTGISTVNTIIGGFHLKQNNLQTKKTIDYLKKLNIKNLFPSHCTSLEAMNTMWNFIKIKPIKTGMVINI